MKRPSGDRLYGALLLDIARRLGAAWKVGQSVELNEVEALMVSNALKAFVRKSKVETTLRGRSTRARAADIKRFYTDRSSTLKSQGVKAYALRALNDTADEFGTGLETAKDLIKKAKRS